MIQGGIRGRPLLPDGDPCPLEPDLFRPGIPGRLLPDFPSFSLSGNKFKRAMVPGESSNTPCSISYAAIAGSAGNRWRAMRMLPDIHRRKYTLCGAYVYCLAQMAVATRHNADSSRGRSRQRAGTACGSCSPYANPNHSTRAERRKMPGITWPCTTILA